MQCAVSQPDKHIYGGITSQTTGCTAKVLLSVQPVHLARLLQLMEHLVQAKQSRQISLKWHYVLCRPWQSCKAPLQGSLTSSAGCGRGACCWARHSKHGDGFPTLC